MLNTLSQLTIHCEVKKKRNVAYSSFRTMGIRAQKWRSIASNSQNTFSHQSMPQKGAVVNQISKKSKLRLDLWQRSNDFIFFLSNSLSTTRQKFYYSNNIKGVLCTCLQQSGLGTSVVVLRRPQWPPTSVCLQYTLVLYLDAIPS